VVLRVPRERSLGKSTGGCWPWAKALCSRRFRVSVGTMSICARTSFRGYRYYRLPNGIPEAAARV
jgi:hypothetical protein